MSTNGHLKFQGTNRATFVGETSNIMFDTTTTSLGIGVTGTDHPSSNLYITGNAYISNSISVGGVLTMGTVNVVARHDLEAVTAMGNTTPLTIEFSNATTGIVTTGNVEVGGELTVSGNVETKNINMLHIANTASIKLNSNVVTEFLRSKKLIKYPRVALTTAANNAYENGYKITYSNPQSGGFLGDDAFDGIFGDQTSNYSLWYSGELSNYTGADGEAASTAPLLDTNTERGEWLGIELPVAIKLQYFYLWQQPNDVQHFPKSGVVYAKKETNDPWVEIYRYDDRTRTDEPDVPEIFSDVNSEVAYKYFVLVFTKRLSQNLSPGYGVAIGEWQLFGVPEHDPDAHGTDVVVKSVPNVPNTDWLDVYFDAKGLPNGAVINPISGLGGTTNNGTAAGGLTVSDGVFTFDGTNDSISTTSTATLSFHTASMWIKFEQFSSWVAVYAIRPASLDRNNAFLYANGTENTFRLEALGNTGPYKDFNYTFEPGKWVHLTVLFDGTGLRDSKLYIDGIELRPNGTVRSDTDDITITGTNTVYMGSEPGYYFTGSFANFRLFNRKLTIDEIYQLYAYQKEYFGHGDLSMTLKAGRLGIGTSEPRAALDVRGDVRFSNVPHIYATDDGGYDDANGAYINFDRVESSNGIALIGTDGTFRITEQAGAGVYYVDGSVSYHQSNGTEVRNLELKIYLNGVSHHSNNRNYGLTAMKHVGGSTYSDLGVTALVKCNVGDTIRLYGISRSSSINVHTPNNKMVIFKVQST